MKCPYCKEEIERFAAKCNVCGEKIAKVHGCIDYLKEVVSSSTTKRMLKKTSIILTAIIAVIILALAMVKTVSYAMSEIENNKLTDNGYKSVVRSDNYTYASHSDADLSELTDRIATLFKDVATEEKDLMEFFKKSKSKEDNVKLFTIFINNVDKYREDTELIYNNASKTFDDLGIKISEPVKSNQFKHIAIVKPAIKCFYLITENTEADGYVFFRYDYKYMLETYAPYLSDDWREYFRLQHESESAFKNLDWDNPKNRPTLRAWGKKWGDFLDKYPNFIYASEFGEYVYELNSY